ncbi:MAG: hypothetical protein HC900_06405, partial [Methylacidiphilales bacterium]|nr:hypothetical protein [Candidatus Methylacidiphilales bacterium]
MLPADMMDWLPQGDIVHLTVDAVALMDLSKFEATRKIGRAGHAQANVEAVIGEDAELGAAVADAGYWSEANAASETEECELFIATRKDHKQRADLRTAPPPRGRMERKLRTKRGRAIYRRRGASVEPVFGQ